MNISYRRTLFKGLMIVTLWLTITSMVFGYVQLNGSGGTYCEGNPPPPDCGEGTDDNKALAPEDTIGDLIVDGAAVYLNAYSGYLAFLNRVELSDRDGLDYEEAGKMLDSVLAYVGTAKETYYRLVLKAESTPYNPAVSAQLAEFDYAGYSRKHRLDRDIFEDVEEYLKNTDVTGTYIYTYLAVKEIESMLLSVRWKVALKTTPDIERLWVINEKLGRTLFFGQYVARVFRAL